MERATAINLVLLGGGLTLVGTTMSLSAHNRLVACERAHTGDPAALAACQNTGSGAHGGGGGSGGGGGRSYGWGYGTESGIARGGFGETGMGFGGGHGGEGGGGE